MEINGLEWLDLSDEQVLRMTAGLQAAVWRGVSEVYVSDTGAVHYYEKDETGWEWHEGTWVKLVVCKQCGEYVLPTYQLDGVCYDCRER